ncbi:hypothetical protein [Shewanella aestuarii]|uniref:Uncharacterized protein n=1 Tax=Shewanella aestuarii TaxID=1028752 RepID=A0A6G9QPP6_9GAMM|nr:hypothetical protein [Shewanella aestuarii]QIR16564.1 hypothetical protein HBH39_19000 [Shewanella aestuarii]
MFQLYRNRSLEMGQTVKVYRNLNNQMFSIVATSGTFKNKVVAHAQSVLLSQVVFKISQSGKRRAVLEKTRNVHAWAVGTLETIDPAKTQYRNLSPISYNPFTSDSFYYKDNLLPLHHTDALLLDNGKAFAA